MGSINFIPSLELQLIEVEMLKSMYPNDCEFNITIPATIADMNNFISGRSQRVPNQLDYSINLQIPDINEKMEVNISLPHDYPDARPNVSVRSSGLNRSQQKKLNLAIEEFLSAQCEGELVVVSLVTWLSNSAFEFFHTQPNTSDKEQECEDSSEVFCRMWIYSHHIYNKFKRREIVDTAQDLKLTGFSLPGKPGFIGIEGRQKDCNDFLQNLKHMSWKKLSLVKEERETMDKDDTADSLRRFDSFLEVSFQARQGPAREYHMDMGLFLKFLEDHHCAYAFHSLFGFEGQHATNKK